MPTGTCRYPHHHSGPSAGPPLGLLVAIGAGALIITHLHAAAGALHAVLIVTLAVVGVLTVLSVAVVMMVHSHRAEPYDGAWQAEDAEEHQHGPIAAALPAPAAQLAARVAEIEQQLADRQAIDAPAVHQHLHLHGLDAADFAAISRQQLDAAWPPPAEQK